MLEGRTKFNCKAHFFMNSFKLYYIVYTIIIRIIRHIIEGYTSRSPGCMLAQPLLDCNKVPRIFHVTKLSSQQSGGNHQSCLPHFYLFFLTNIIYFFFTPFFMFEFIKFECLCSADIFLLVLYINAVVSSLSPHVLFYSFSRFPHV